MFVGNQQQITVNRLTLLEKLKENRGNHARDFAIAVREYYAALKTDLEKALADLNAANRDDFAVVSKITVPFDRPRSGLKDYDNVIAMLEMSVEENIVLDSNAFRQYVQDQWNWTELFNNTRSIYASKIGGHLG